MIIFTAGGLVLWVIQGGGKQKSLAAVWATGLWVYFTAVVAGAPV